jgi:hypothetical protein
MSYELFGPTCLGSRRTVSPDDVISSGRCASYSAKRGPSTPEHRCPNLRSSARTDAGQVRETNQGAMVCLNRLVAVADGTGGGPRAGISASSLAVAIVKPPSLGSPSTS